MSTHYKRVQQWRRERQDRRTEGFERLIKMSKRRAPRGLALTSFKGVGGLKKRTSHGVRAPLKGGGRVAHVTPQLMLWGAALSEVIGGEGVGAPIALRSPGLVLRLLWVAH